MKRIIIILILVIFTTSILYSDTSTSLRRLAILVGANYGGPDRKKLRYAVSDAKAIAKVFQEMGGIYSSDEVLLEEPDKDELVREIKKLKEKVTELKGKHGRIEFIFYYSGHSDEEGVLLGKEKYYYKDLKEIIKEIPSDMNIVIVDSCASGALTRIKGGKKRPPFLVDTSMNMKGYAILTSSSSEEVSQESDKIGGSFFTHYLVSGLRGAADTTRDGRVTLNEVYQYAYHETLARTEKTISGPQHPNYDIQMTGAGDVIITDIKENSAGIILEKNSFGKYFIRRRIDLRLVAEINKQQGRTVEVGLEAGDYNIALEKNEKYYTGKVDLKEGSFVKINDGKLRKEKREYAQSRGNSDPGSNEETIISKPISSYDHGGFGGPALKISTLAGKSRLFLGGRGAWILDHTFSLGGAGYGMVSELKGVVNGTNVNFQIGYGGVEIGYIHRSDSLLHLNFMTLIGAGGIKYQLEGAEKDDKDMHFFSNSETASLLFAIEPMLYLELNIAKWFRLCLGGGYHYFSIVKGLEYFTQKELSGPS
ncbi:MAG: caspase family protein, partial [Spirochaetes bacterium]|nr:caspase family protein [Spirochaetota bacterium]